MLGSIEVSVLGLGTGRLASLGAGNSSREIARLLDTASELGITFIDTADTYGSSAAERILGNLLRSRPGRFHVATKGGLAVADLPGPLRPLNQFAKKGLQKAGRVDNFAPAVIRKRLEASLRRLRTDAVDVYYLHLPPLQAVRDEQLIATMGDALKSGKIRQFGISSDDPAVLRVAVELAECTVVQTHVSPFAGGGGFEETRTEMVAAGMSVVANHVLAGADGPPSPVQQAIARRASEVGLSQRGVLIRHAAAQPGVAVVLVGTSNPAHLRENASTCMTPVEADDVLQVGVRRCR